jgi:peptidyl-prolyl cis-trans isomerase C
MKKRIILSLALGTSLLAGAITSYAADEDKVVATVNGTKISEWTVQRYAKQRGLPQGMGRDQRGALIEELINRELIYQDALNIGVDKTPAIQAEIEHMKVNIIASAMLNRSSDRFEVKEADMKAEYDKRKGELGGTELKARHILLENEADAKAVIADLDKGADFVALAKERSTGPTGPQGGDLGWFQPGQMVKEFSAAAQELKKGSYTKAPVKTQFGWHVILLEDTRTVAPPAYDLVKEQIRAGLQNRLMEAYIGGLREKAKISRP